MSLNPWSIVKKNMFLNHWHTVKENMFLNPWHTVKENMSVNPWSTEKENMFLKPWRTVQGKSTQIFFIFDVYSIFREINIFQEMSGKSLSGKKM